MPELKTESSRGGPGRLALLRHLRRTDAGQEQVDVDMLRPTTSLKLLAQGRL